MSNPIVHPTLEPPMRAPLAAFSMLTAMVLASSLSAQATAQRVVVSKAGFGTPIERLRLTLDDSPGHLITQTSRVDSVTSSDS